MKFPSLANIITQTILVVRRYPIELLAAITGTYAAAQLTFRNSEGTESLLTRLLFVAALALPAYLAVTIRARFRRFTTGRRAIEYGVITALLILFFFSLSNPPLQRDFMRFMLLEVAAHLLVASAGFVGRGSTLAFWQ